MLTKQFTKWLNSFYSEYPLTFRVFWFMVGWTVGSAVKMAVLQHRLNKR